MRAEKLKNHFLQTHHSHIPDIACVLISRKMDFNSLSYSSRGSPEMVAIIPGLNEVESPLCCRRIQIENLISPTPAISSTRLLIPSFSPFAKDSKQPAKMSAAIPIFAQNCEVSMASSDVKSRAVSESVLSPPPTDRDIAHVFGINQ